MNENKSKKNKLTGLSHKEVDKRINQGQTNEIEEDNPHTILHIIATHLINLPNVVLIVSMVFLAVFEQYQDVLMISIVFIVNTFISILQEVQAKRSLNKINVINKTQVQVLRSGSTQEIDPEEIVKDDIIKLESGQQILVDGQVEQSNHVVADESILTGESEYVRKTKGDKVFSGSFIISGNGYYKAEKVGSESFINKISQEAKKYINHLSPLQKHINQLVKALTYLALGILALLFVMDLLVFNMDKVQLLFSVISIVTSLIPQGVLMTLTITFMLGVIRMYRKKILVQKANAIESLANTQVICMDKTGTITKNQLKVENLELMEKNSNPQERQFKQNLLNTYTHNTLEKNKTIKAIAEHINVNSNHKIQAEVINQIPFISKNKYSGMQIVLSDGTTYSIVLGSVEKLIDAVKDQAQKEAILKAEKKFADQGLRNLLFVYKKIQTDKKSKQTGDWFKADQQKQSNLDYLPLALVSLKDELRPGAESIIRSFLDQNIKIVIITGDSARTVSSIIKQINLKELNRVTTGQELEDMTQKVQNKEVSESELDQLILATDIFARTSPEQKLQITETLQKYMSPVAMIGDGVNDALAIKHANLGIAMGQGANVARDIADIVLLDNDLNKLADVIKEGKEILFNTLRISEVLLVKNVYAVIIILAALLFRLDFPFNPRGLFVLSFINATVPASIMLLESHHNVARFNFMKKLMNFILLNGFFIGTLTSIILAAYSSHDFAYTQSIILSFLILVGVVNALIVIQQSYSLKKMFFGSISSIMGALMIGIYLFAMYVPVVSELFMITPLHVNDWLVLLGITIGYLVSVKYVNQFLKKIYQRFF